MAPATAAAGLGVGVGVGVPLRENMDEKPEGVGVGVGVAIRDAAVAVHQKFVSSVQLDKTCQCDRDTASVRAVQDQINKRT